MMGETAAGPGELMVGEAFAGPGALTSGGMAAQLVTAGETG